MTVKELIEELNHYPKDTPILIAGVYLFVHYEITEIDLEYDDDYEKDVVLLYLN